MIVRTNGRDDAALPCRRCRPLLPGRHDWARVSPDRWG